MSGNIVILKIASVVKRIIGTSEQSMPYRVNPYQFHERG